MTQTAETVPRQIENIEGSLEISPGETHFRDLGLAAGDFVYVFVQQQGIDVVLRLLAPDSDELLIRVDSPTGSQGVEELVAIASESGRYRLEIVGSAKAAAAGRISFEIHGPRASTSADRARVEADAKYRRARALLKEDRPEAAMALLEEILPAWRQLGLLRQEAETHDHLRIALASQEQAASALEHMEKALIGYRAVNDSRLAASLYNAATYLTQVGRPGLAIERLQEALAIYESRGDDRARILCLSRMGTARWQQGLFQKALTDYDQARELASSSKRRSLEAMILTDSGWAYLALHDADTALEHYESAVRAYRDSGRSRGLVAALRGYSMALLRTARVEEAVAALEEALDILSARAGSRSHGLILYALGEAEAARSARDVAEAHFRQALELAIAASDRQTEAMVRLSLGHLLAENGQIEEGLQELDRARELFSALESSAGLASARARLAQALQKAGRLQEAWQHLEPALQALEDVRASTRRRDLRSGFFGYRQDYFEIASDLLIALHEAEPEVGYASQALFQEERRRARELLDALLLDTEGEVRSQAAAASEEKHLEHELRRFAEKHLEGTELTPAQLREQSRLTERLYELSAAGPPAPPRSPAELILDPATIRAELLDPGTLLLVYSLGRHRSFLWEVTSERLDIHILAARAEIEQGAEKFLKALRQIRHRSRAGRIQAGRELASLLLEPVASRLDGQRLVLVLDGPLNQLPFAALPSPAASEHEKYLVEDHEIVVLPSASMLARVRSQPGEHRSPTRVLAVGDPVFGYRDSRVERPDEPESPPHAEAVRILRAARALGVDEEKRLFASGRECVSIVDMAGAPDSRSLLGFRASRQELLETDWSAVDVLHIATHAVLHPSAELSALLLSRVGPDGEPIDGMMTAIEIARMDLPLELAVLSACQTGTGRYLAGEGQQSLAYAFLHAGAHRVLASLWKVSDDRTADLMEAFYRAYLVEDLPASAALRRAQMQMLSKPKSVPRDWAGFVLQGDWR